MPTKSSQEILDQLENQQENTPTETPSEAAAEQPKKVVYPSCFDKFADYKATEAEDLVHAAIAKVHYNQATGEYDGQAPYVAFFNVRDYETFLASAPRMGYTVKLLHHPTKQI